MTSTLLIVESPKKAKTIAHLFSELTVKATVGHIADLPVKEMGVEPPEHKPVYETIKGKEKMIAGLRAAANTASKIYLATDLDREGEAIAMHVRRMLGNKHAAKIARVTYNEINKTAIKRAIESAHDIRWPFVRAQEGRRLVDRYVGYMISKILTQKIKEHFSISTLPFLSAGRVQSVAVKLIVVRQREIESFKSTAHYGVRVVIHNPGKNFTADWVPRSDQYNDEKLIVDRAAAEVVKEITSVLHHTHSESKRAAILPPRPLTTDKFVQFCAGKLKLTTKHAMASAQRLHEQGLITYHRTDSPVMSDEAVTAVRAYATNKQLPIPSKPPVYSAGASAQEAHECLRVSDIHNKNPSGLEYQDEAVYQLIWEVTLLSQLERGVDNRKTVWFNNGNEAVFKSCGRSTETLGWRTFKARFFGAKEAPKNNREESAEQQLPVIQDKATFSDLSVSIQDKKTQPPAFLTEKTLVEKLSKLGVGRPSTYAQTIEKIVSMQYVTRESKSLRFQSTPLGAVTVDALVPYFKFMDEHYTAGLEAKFDEIGQGKAQYQTVVDEVYKQLTQEISLFTNGKISTQIKESDLAPYGSRRSDKSNQKKINNVQKNKTYRVSDQCPECNKGKVEMRAFEKDRSKKFLGCSRFPKCRFFAWP